MKLPSLLSEYKLQIWIGLAILFTVISLLWFPRWQVSQFQINNATEQATLENQYRAILAQMFGGVAVAIGIYSAWKNIKIAQETLESNQNKAQVELKLAQDTLVANQKSAQENLKIAQEGQITERFTRAVDQLGNDKIEIRLGGIYALERISSESEKDYWPIMKILAAYIREKSKENTGTEDYEQQDKDKLLSTDIQAILDLICQREHSFNEKLDLRNSNLRNAQLFEARLEEADLRGAHLEKANLERAHLECTLSGAHLEGAILWGAHLEGAVLSGAHLEGAILWEAYLEGAILWEAHLEGADFQWAQLEKARLEEANLKGAVNLTINQLSKVKTLYNATLDLELEIPLKEKYPALFDKPDD